MEQPEPCPYDSREKPETWALWHRERVQREERSALARLIRRILCCNS